ncbi:metal-dependent phosphohydrolase, partial [Pseudomonas sp. HMWF010]
MTCNAAADAFVADLTDVFNRLGHLRYGEGVSQMQHA